MVALAPPLAPAAAASPDEISELVSRGLSAATLLTEVAEVSVAEAKELQRSVADAVRSAPASASTSGSVMRNFELHLDNKLDSLETQTALVTKPLVKQRKVWGGAHAVERGSTRPVPLPSAPKVYGVHAPSARRLAAIGVLHNGPKDGSGLRPSASVPVHSCGAARASSFGSGGFGGGSSPPRRAAATAPLDLSSSLGPRLAASASAGLLVANLDGLTPGQRYLGARSEDRLAGVRRAHNLFAAAVPIMPPPPPTNVLRDSSRALAAKRAGEEQRRRLFGQASRSATLLPLWPPPRHPLTSLAHRFGQADWWLAHADDDDGGYVELDEAAAKEERQRLGRGGGAGSPRSPRRSPRAKRSQSVPPIEQPSSPPPLQASPSHHHVGAATLHAKQPALPSHASGQGRSAHKRVKPLNQRQGQRTTMANAPYTPEPWGAETPLSRPLTPLDHDLRRSASASMLTNRGASVTASPNAPNARSSLQGRISPQREGVAPTRSGRISPSIDRAPSVFDSGAQARFSFVPQQKSLRNPSM